MKREISSLIGQGKGWGSRLFAAPSKTPKGMALEVTYRKTPSDETVVAGRLRCEGDEYVFRYDAGYAGAPVFAFPDLKRECRSRVLWPFFAARVPPFGREDMRQEMARRSLGEDRILEILGTLAKTSVANPYEFRLA